MLIFLGNHTRHMKRVFRIVPPSPSLPQYRKFMFLGDHTLSATVLAINELGLVTEQHDESFVIVLSDANFDRYGIRPENFAKILNRETADIIILNYYFYYYYHYHSRVSFLLSSCFHSSILLFSFFCTVSFTLLFPFFYSPFSTLLFSCFLSSILLFPLF